MWLLEVFLAACSPLSNSTSEPFCLYSRCACQANAEPDLQQTGDRLKGLVAGLVEGILELVADPLAARQHSCQQVNGLPAGSAARLGHWIKVYEKQQHGRGLGGSGMQML